MRAAVVSFCLVSTVASAEITEPYRDIRRWFSTNQDGFCTLNHFAGAAGAELEFQFSSRPGFDEQPIFQVIRKPHDLVWPVRVQLGSDWDARRFEIGGDTGSTFLMGAVAQSLLQYLKDGGDVHFTYSLKDGVERRVTLGQLRFRQSVAMFETCLAHVA
jgi:hypothetical protein